jgi:phosphopantetheinyl transferase
MDNEMQDVNCAFSRAVATISVPRLEGECMAAWALDYMRPGRPRVELLGSPAQARMPDEDQLMVWLGAPGSDLGELRAAAIPLLDPEEQATAARLRNPADQRTSLAAHAGVRLMLGAAMDVPPRSIPIHRGQHGKPLIEGGSLHFSLAHVRGAVAVALARRPVGIDIERKAALPDMAAVAAAAFAPEAQRALEAAQGEARTEIFYRFWTLGEAFVKATGLGVLQGLNSFAFTSEGEPCLTRVTPGWGSPERWRFGVC